MPNTMVLGVKPGDVFWACRCAVLHSDHGIRLHKDTVSRCQSCGTDIPARLAQARPSSPPPPVRQGLVVARPGEVLWTCHCPVTAHGVEMHPAALGRCDRCGDSRPCAAAPHER